MLFPEEHGLLVVTIFLITVAERLKTKPKVIVFGQSQQINANDAMNQ